MPRRAKLHLKQARIAVIPSETRNLLFPAARRSPLSSYSLLHYFLASLFPALAPQRRPATLPHRRLRLPRHAKTLIRAACERPSLKSIINLFRADGTLAQN